MSAQNLTRLLQQFPAKDAHLQFQKWAEEYGPIYSIILGTRVMIVLNKDYLVRDLLDKKSAIYSSRPDLYIGYTVTSGCLRASLTVSNVTSNAEKMLT